MIGKYLLNGSVVFIFLLSSGCVEEIAPESFVFDDLLVVEGLITDQNQSHLIKLSRTFPVNGNEPPAETGATVSVTTSSGKTIVFVEEQPGFYYPETPFKATLEDAYQLNIVTADDREYRSDMVEMEVTPSIDSVYAEYEPLGGFVGNGLFNFFLDSGSNNNGARFYRWTWIETFQLRVPLPSKAKWLGGNEFIVRDQTVNQDQAVEFCYNSDTSSRIIVGSSGLQSGEIIKFPIRILDSKSKKLYLQYSIEVKQYGLSETAYQYWENIASSSQNQGSLFDEQPGALRGNIRSVNDDNEIVLGIFEVAQEKKYRKFYKARDFENQGYSPPTLFWVQCNPEIFEFTSPDSIGHFMEENGDEYEIWFLSSGFFGPAGIYYQKKRCSNCTLYGDNAKPDFWIF